MFEETILPQKLVEYIAGERRDFTIKAKSDGHGFSFLLMIFSLFFVVIPIIIGFFVFSSGTWKYIIPVIFPALFLLVGLVLFYNQVRLIFQKEYYFIGTPQRLIYYSNGYITSMGWDSFTNEISSYSDSEGAGKLILTLKDSSQLNQGTNKGQNIHDTINMIGIKNVAEIEKICREKIENFQKDNPVG